MGNERKLIVRYEQNIQRLWNTTKKSSSWFIGIEEEFHAKITEIIFNKIIADNFPSLWKGMTIQVQKAKSKKLLRAHHRTNKVFWKLRERNNKSYMKASISD